MNPTANQVGLLLAASANTMVENDRPTKEDVSHLINA
jgi:hypothetical protein